MKTFLQILFFAFLFIGCQKESSEDDTYGYETECEYCDINYINDVGVNVYVYGHKGSWKKEFPRSIFSEMRITVTAKQSTSKNVSAHITKNGGRLVSQSGYSSVTARHTVIRSGTSKPVSDICGAPTQKGVPCQRIVSGGGRCWQHQ